MACCTRDLARAGRALPLACAALATLASLPAQRAAAEAPAKAASAAVRLPRETVALLQVADPAGAFEQLRASFAVPVEALPPRLRGGLSLARVAVRVGTGASVEDLLDELSSGGIAVALVAPPDRRPFWVASAALPDGASGARLARRLGRYAKTAWEDGVLTVAGSARDLEFVREARREGRTLVRAPAAAPPRQALRLFVDLAAIARRAGGRGLGARLDPPGRFLLGPIAGLLDRADRFDATVRLGPDGFVLDGEFDAAWDEGSGAAVLALAGEARALPAIPADAFGVVALDRSLLAFFRDAAQILNESDATQLRAGLSVAATLLGGASVVEDLLPGIVEPVTLIALERGERAAAEPRIKLPGFALVAPLRDERAHELLSRGLRTAFLINSKERSDRGEKPFRLRRSVIGGQAGVTIEADDWEGVGDPPLQSDLSITLVAAHDHVVLATTRAAAQRVVAALDGGESTKVRGDHLSLRGVAIADLVGTHRDLLALNAALEKGEDLDKARTDLELVEFVLREIDRAELTVSPDGEATRVSLRIQGVR